MIGCEEPFLKKNDREASDTAYIYALYAKWLILNEYDPALILDLKTAEADAASRDEALNLIEAEILRWEPSHDLQIIPMLDILFNLEGEPPLSSQYGTLARIKLFLSRTIFTAQRKAEELAVVAIPPVVGVQEPEDEWWGYSWPTFAFPD